MTVEVRGAYSRFGYDAAMADLAVIDPLRAPLTPPDNRMALWWLVV